MLNNRCGVVGLVFCGLLGGLGGCKDSNSATVDGAVPPVPCEVGVCSVCRDAGACPSCADAATCPSPSCADAATCPSPSCVDAGTCPSCPQVVDAGGDDSYLGGLLAEGQRIFRYDTFGDEVFWGGGLKLHQAIAGAANGGVGTGVSPRVALTVGLKVDVDALPDTVRSSLKAGTLNLDDPAVTLALLKLNAVVGVTGIFNGAGALTSMGIQCAFCHSTVDDSFAPGIGKRMDGWANRDLNVGTIIGLAPDLSPITSVLGVDEATVRTVLAAWGPGKFDAQLILDGKGFRPDGTTAATLIPPAFGLAGWNLHTSTGFGSVPYWNAFVAILEMHGQGRFFDPRLNDANRFPVATRAKLYDVTPTGDDMVTSKLPALQVYQLSLPAPTPPPGSFDPASAARGDALFGGKARCTSCHTEPLWAEPGYPIHSGAEIGIDNFQSQRSPANGYRTAPLNGLWTRQKGGFYHDGRFATLADVVSHYQSTMSLGLSTAEQADLVEYLKSLPTEAP
jgi:hypothetical protein